MGKEVMTVRGLFPDLALKLQTRRATELQPVFFQHRPDLIFEIAADGDQLRPRRRHELAGSRCS
ncbi:hypothetical protein X743_33355 [Mesorhizobium sp. LNHC252B00]|nr:hypothetical protein X743_33355 [Mesorhizobium sp. LNHC252B00]